MLWFLKRKKWTAYKLKYVANCHNQYVNYDITSKRNCEFKPKIAVRNKYNERVNQWRAFSGAELRFELDFAKFDKPRAELNLGLKLQAREHSDSARLEYTPNCYHSFCLYRYVNSSDSDQTLERSNPIKFGFENPIQILSYGSKDNLRIWSNSDRTGVRLNLNPEQLLLAP